MPNPIGARKDGDFKAVSTAPSINLTPAGSSVVPVAYPVVSDLSGSVGTVAKVRANGNPVYVLDLSSQPSCKGDAAGTDKGVKSGTLSGTVTPIKGSSTVRAKKKAFVRHGDPCHMQGKNCTGQYVVAPHPSGAISGGQPTQSTNPPIKPQTPKEKSAFRKWWDKAVNQMKQAVLHPMDGLIGAAKGIANIPSQLLETVIKGQLMEQASDTMANAGLMEALGQHGAAQTLAQVAQADQSTAQTVSVPKFQMSNDAQEGGDKISTVVQLGLMFTGVGEAAVASDVAKVGKGAEALTDGSKVLVAGKEGAKELATAEEAGKVMPKVRGPGDGVKIVKLSADFATEPNKAYFWSGLGRGGDKVAAKIASSHGGTTLEQLLETRGIDIPPWDASNPVSVQAWENASQAYAQGASGTVNAVIGDTLRPGNIWETMELPALKTNPNVTEIIQINPTTGSGTSIFSRGGL
jgi:hypothetical protein